MKKNLIQTIKWSSLGLFLFSLEVLAEEVPASGGASGQENGLLGSQPPAWMNFAPFLLMFAVMYFLVIRPQQKRAKEQQQMISALKQGDQVVTHAGILGTLIQVSEKVVTLEVAQNVQMRVLKNQISQVINGSMKDFV